ncbi:MAG: hypothetical protein NTY19_23520 [Planctomycetota bacterium]|nr:hypothetical protein [Planctomycetota bacterium]
MTDREIDNMLWRAFILGARVIADQNGKDVTASDMDALAVVVRQIAESDIALEDPTTLAAKAPGIGSALMRVGTAMIRNDREVSKRIFRGFIIATE